MNRKAFKTCMATLAAGLGLLGGALPAAAQTPPGQTPATTTTVGFPGDWPNLGAFSNRQGRNGNPYAYTPGIAALRYQTPSTAQERLPIALYPTDLQANEFSRQPTTPQTPINNVYDDPLNSAFSAAGVVLSYAAFTPGVVGAPDWLPVVNADGAAADIAPIPYRRARNTNATYPLDFAPRDYQFVYATATPAARNQVDPTIPQSGTAKVFTWNFAPPAGNSRTYAIYVNLPIGPTTIPANAQVPGGAQLPRYTQPYFVYEIRWGSTLATDGLPINRIVDVVSANANSVRLGIPGKEGNTVFPSDGSPIVVRLFNTVPRYSQLPKGLSDDTTNRLTLPGSTVGDSDTTESAAALVHLTYADAMTLRPVTGTYSAPPTAATLSGNALSTTLLEDLNADWDVSVARNDLVTGFQNGTYFVANQGTVINYQANAQKWLPPTSPTSNVPYEKWRYSVLDTSAATTTVDNPATATPASAFVVGTVNPYFNGTNYLTAPATTNSGAGLDSVAYAPNLAAGDYAIYAYLPGNRNGEVYGQHVLYQINEGSVVTSVYVDQSINRGWYRIGTRRFTSSGNDVPDLTVNVYNQSIVSTSPLTGEAAGTRVYADAIRFVSTANGGVTSAPVHATVAMTPQGGGTPVPTKVVFVADESGKIHCLDEVGRGDGTTTEYWSYPSTPDLTDDSWVDPNLFASTSSGDPDHDPASGDLTTPTVPGPDGAYSKLITPFRNNAPSALMPSGFNLSTAVVAHVNDPTTPTDPTTGRDLLYIGATNGRVYCIDTSGRGDYNVTTRKVGTARRQWSFPNDYPQAVETSALGGFQGSLVFGDANQGANGPTIFVPANQGRVYALDAYGTPVTNGSISGTTASVGTGGVTATKWQFPTAAHATLPKIVTTPTLMLPTGGTDGRLMFGTQINTTDDSSAQFYAVNAKTGDVVWDINGEAYDPTGTLGVDPHILSTTVRQTDASLSTITDTTNYTSVIPFADFSVGPVAVDAATLAAVPAAVTSPTAAVDTLYVLNDNGYLYGLRVADGTLVASNTGSLYRTPTLTVGSGTLVYSVVRSFSRTFVSGYFPEILIPGNQGEIVNVFARPDDFSSNGYIDGSQILYNSNNNPLGVPIATTGLAAADNYLFSTDDEGGFTAFGEDASGLYINVPPYDSGTSNKVSVNNPIAQAFRHLHIKLVNRAGYLALKKVNTDGTGGLTYAQLTAGTYDKPRTPAGSNNPYAFEWGETAYVAVYGFPYATYAPTNPVSRIAPPTINVTLTSDGGSARSFPVDSRQFNNPTASPAVEATDPNTGMTPVDPNNVAYVQDGYAIVPIAFSNAGSTSLPPGGGTISAMLSTGALSSSGASQPIYPDTRTGYGTSGLNDAVVRFVLANPLAIAIADSTTGLPSTDTALQIGYNSSGENLTSTGMAENLVNGTPNIPGEVSPIFRSQLQASAGIGNHGSTTTARVYVYDRSLMVLLQEDGIGNVRMLRTNLQRQGGAGAIYGALDPAKYPGFEDKPINLPNTSLDYPDVGREQIRAAATADGSTGNPVLTNVRLATPTVLGSMTPLSAANIDANNDRTLQGTPVDLMIDLPLYQPPVNLALMPGYSNDPTYRAVGPDNVNNILAVRHNSESAQLAQGYFGRVQVFVDSTNNGQLTTAANGRKPYRGFNLSAGVNPQYSILTGSPNVDLGSLAAGTGVQTGTPSGVPFAGGLFDPWVGAWSGVYQPFSVRNDGNVNLLNLRVVKGTNDTPNANATSPWTLTTVDNDPLSYLTAELAGTASNANLGSLWSNIDNVFATPNLRDSTVTQNHVILPKPRVTDRVPTELVADPYPRANPNLRIVAGAVVQSPGSTAGVAVNGSNNLRLYTPYLPTTPKIGVSVPLGFPVGNYSSQFRVVEDGSLTTVADFGEILQYNAGVYEAYSDPITLTWKVRETRMTNRSTPRTSPVIDNGGLFPSVDLTKPHGPDGTLAVRNVAPAAMRAADGSVLVAWESERNALVPSGTAPDRIFLAGLKSNARFGGGGDANPSAYNPPLWDLTQFDTTAPTWFRTNPAAFPAPAQVDALFPGNVAETVRFGSPSFTARSNASVYDFAAGGTGTIYMGFVGDAQVTTATGRLAQSKVFLTQVAMDSNGIPSANGLLATASDPQTVKGKPSVLSMDGGGAFLFYSETSAGQSSITADRLTTDGRKFAPPVSLDFGAGFSSVFSPSATARVYHRSLPDAAPIIEMSFAGKLRGRANAEAYLGRLRLGFPNGTDANDASYSADTGSLQLLDVQGRTAEYAKAGTPFILLPTQSNERLLSEGNGSFRARGVAWDRTGFLAAVRAAQPAASPAVNSPLVQYTTSSTTGAPVATDLLVPGTAVVDRQSGLIVCDSRLGGKVTIDPALGTVRFVGAAISPSAEIRLTYAPTFLRVTPGGAGAYSSINGMFDDRYAQAADANRNAVAPAYWFSGSAQNSTGNIGNTSVRSDRYLYAYSRGAAGGGVTARPYMTTMRIGVRLPTRVATDGAGNVVGISVTGNSKPYQVDPANGRVYFQAEDENQPVTISYIGANEATNQPLSTTITLTNVHPSFVLERSETPIAIDEATNESGLTAFLDPFTFNNVSSPNQARPPLVWLFYVSTRAGQPDLYFQTIAPNFTPFSK